jgi:hypothetical protein
MWARPIEGGYSTYLADEQRRQRAKDRARCEHSGAVGALASTNRRNTAPVNTVDGYAAAR